MEGRYQEANSRQKLQQRRNKHKTTARKQGQKGSFISHDKSFLLSALVVSHCLIEFLPLTRPVEPGRRCLVSYGGAEATLRRFAPVIFRLIC
jgi:hypothetical protein